MKLNTKQTFIKQMGNVNWLCLKLDDNQLEALNKILNNDKKETVIDISNKVEHRSLSANAYCHVLIEKIAKLLTSTHDEIYEHMLLDYGVQKYPICTPKKIASYKQDYKFVEVMNKLKVQITSGKMVDAVQLKCTVGSSKYDTLQMSQFIEGIKTECDTLGIEVKSPQEINNLIKMMEDK